jgi:hypothetical protein
MAMIWHNSFSREGVRPLFAKEIACIGNNQLKIESTRDGSNAAIVISFEKNSFSNDYEGLVVA